MALEQLRAFRAGTSQSELGETRRLDPDGFPLLVSSPLQRQHEDISALLRNQGNDHGGQKLMQDPVLLKMLSADTETRTGYFLALGTNYQLQVSQDLSSWANFGLPFTATSSLQSQYVDAGNFGAYFRLITP